MPLTYVMVYILNQKRNFTFSLTVWRGSWLFDTIQWFVCSINDLAKFWFQYSKGTNQKSQIQQQSLRAAHGYACCFFSGQQFYFGTGRYIYFGTGRYQKCRVKNPDSVNQHLSNLIDFRFNNAFPIEISDAVFLCFCLILSRFFMFSNERNTL